jgi:hypothetical protein
MKYHLLILFLLSLSFIAKSQVSNYTEVYVHRDFYDELTNPILNSEKEILGSPFLDSTFNKGTIILGQAKLDIPMRYNIYLDLFELTKDNAILFMNSEIVDTVILNDKTFIFIHKEKRKGAYEVLFENSTGSVLKKHRVSFNKGATGVPFKEDVPPHYRNNLSEFYFYYKTGLVLRVTSLKQLADYFPQHKNEMKKFIKKNKLKRDKEEHLVNVFEYLCQLSQ